MHHVAIMKKSWGFLDKIYSGDKMIESRWYMTRRAPWGMVSVGDTIYFKNSGELITLKAKVKKVLAFSDLSPKKVKEVLYKYAKADGISPEDQLKFFKLFKDKRYCLLIFLSNIKKVKPFDIDKSGFGAMTAWITLSSIRSIKKAF